MKKQDYDVAVECYRNHMKNIEDLDDKGLFIMKPCGECSEKPCSLNGFEKVVHSEDYLWTAREVHDFHEDKIASIYKALQGHLPCDMNWFCDGCPVEDDCVDEKIFKKDAVKGVHYICCECHKCDSCIRRDTHPEWTLEDMDWDYVKTEVAKGRKLEDVCHPMDVEYYRERLAKYED